MSTLIAKIDRFVRWFFNVSPMWMSIEPRPQRRRAGTDSRAARPASPKQRREPRSPRKAKASPTERKEGA